MGASYEGYEEKVLALLKSIDARCTNLVNGEEVSDMSGRLGRKGSRELKGLVVPSTMMLVLHVAEVTKGRGSCCYPNECQNPLLECSRA